MGQGSLLWENIEYKATIEGSTGNGDVAPFWFTNNRYGLGSTETNSALFRVNLHRNSEADSLRNWRFGYGADLAGALKHDSKFIVQQLYADIQYKAIRLSVGQKERPLELKNNDLSTGGMTSGINARPLPQIRIELPDFWTIPRTNNWLALKAHIAYGMYTDNKWQKKFTQGTSNIYSANSLYHSKAGYLRIGNPEKFPVTITGGIEMSCQFGGEAWNLSDREDHTGPFDSHQKMNSGLKGVWHAFIPGGSDANDGDYSNVEGNHLGSWHLRADFEKKGWGASFYAEHFFDDHSQMGLQYNWKDMLFGGEVHFPKNPFVCAILYEHINTCHQSGPIYHDATETLPISIAGIDNYYNHHIYGAWQHAGMSMGNPLIISPTYNKDGRIIAYNNRVKANHIGISGQPYRDISYRILFTHERSIGSYEFPATSPLFGNFVMVEATYKPHKISGLAITGSYGQNSGKLLGESKGCLLTISYSGWINKKTK